MNTMRLSPETAETLRASEMRHAFEVAFCFALLALISVPSALVLSWLVAAPRAWRDVGILFTVSVFGFLAVWALWSGWRGGKGHVARVVDVLTRLPEPEMNQDSMPAVPAAALPALPALNETFVLRAGGRVVEIPRNLVHGFDPRDLEWLAKYLAHGGKFTESAMENIPLPYSGERLGKAEEGTNYTRLMELCTERGIIAGRDRRKAGTLAVLDAGEIWKRLRQP